MEPAWPENPLLSPRETAVEELARAQGLTTQLKMLLEDDHGVSVATKRDFADKIMDSLVKALTILTTAPNYVDRSEHEGSRSTPTPLSSLSSMDCPKSEESDEGLSLLAKRSDRRVTGRGCYKRRRGEHTRIEEAHSWVEDGHAWRKYGQKDINNQKYPRSYFRCTYKLDQNCPATKHVEQIQDNPPMFRTTYYGQHTCRNPVDITACSSNESLISGLINEFKNDRSSAGTVVIRFDKRPTDHYPFPLPPATTRQPQVIKDDPCQVDTFFDKDCSHSGHPREEASLSCYGLPDHSAGVAIKSETSSDDYVGSDMLSYDSVLGVSAEYFSDLSELDF